jgi:hypothetical protein
MNNGQPSFSECTSGPRKVVVPGPASVELHRFKEAARKISVNLVGNEFTFNLRAPLAFRDITVDDPYLEESSWEIKHDISDDSPVLLHSLRLSLKHNLMSKNCLQRLEEKGTKNDEKQLPTHQRKKAKRGEDGTKSNKKRYPDGNSILVIRHRTFDDLSTFPSCYEDLYPEEREDDQYKDDYSYDEW